MSALEKREKSLKLAVLKGMTDADTLTDASGNELATYRLNKGRKGYTVPDKPPARELRLKGGNGDGE